MFPLCFLLDHSGQLRISSCDKCMFILYRHDIIWCNNNLYLTTTICTCMQGAHSPCHIHALHRTIDTYTSIVHPVNIANAINAT